MDCEGGSDDNDGDGGGWEAAAPVAEASANAGVKRRQDVQLESHADLGSTSDDATRSSYSVRRTPHRSSSWSRSVTAA